MLVLNKRFSVLATLLTFLIVSNTPTPTSAAAIRARADSSPTTTGAPSITQAPYHQDRPSDLGLPEGTEPDSAASRKGLSNGRWSVNASRSYSHTRTWSGTRTRTWIRPTTTPASGSGSDGVSKRGFREGVAPTNSRRRYARHNGPSRLPQKSSSSTYNMRKRSAIISNEKGNRYVVPRKVASPHMSSQRSYSSRQRRHLVSRDEAERGTPGVINIMSHVNNAQPGKKIASLYLEDTKSDGPYVLNASEKNATEIRLVPAVPAHGGVRVVTPSPRRRQESSSDSDEMLVHLRVEINNTVHCATYDPNPPEAEPLTMQPCMEEGASPGGPKDPNQHKSQVFSFDPQSGVIRPMWYAGEDDGKTDAASVHAAEDANPSDASSPSSSSTSAATPSVTELSSSEDPSSSLVPSSSASLAAAMSATTSDSPASTALSAAAASASASDSSTASSPAPTSASITTREPSSSAQNVTLVFVPSTAGKPSTAAVAGDESSISASPSPSVSGSASVAGNDAVESTAIMTTTITVTAAGADETATPSSVKDSSATPAPTPSATVASNDLEDDGASSTTTITISASAASVAPSPTSAGGQGSLNVQVVGADGKTVGDDDPTTANPDDDDPSTGSDAGSDPTAGSATPTAAGVIDPGVVASKVGQLVSTAKSVLGAAPTGAAPAPPVSPPVAPPAVPLVGSSEDSSSSSAAPTPTSSGEEALVAVKNGFNSRVARRDWAPPKMTPVSTAPYKWLFNLYY